MIAQEQIEKIHILRLNSPPSNALTTPLLKKLTQEINNAAKDPSVHALVLATALPRYFSSGLDIDEISSLPAARRHEPFEALFKLYRAILEVPKPTIAAISGTAFLGGWIIALACDWRLLDADRGRIALCEIRFGLSPTAILLRRMRDISSHPTLIKEMVLAGRTLRAPEALAGNFVDYLIAPEQLNDQALRQARHLAKLPQTAYAAIKKDLLQDFSDQDWEKSWKEFRVLLNSPAALNAFNEG